jgi:hypothetical protein
MSIRFNLKDYLNDVFVETGLFKGEGSLKAIRAGFQTVYSIEVNQRFITELPKTIHGSRLVPHLQNGRMNTILGNSAIELPKLLEQLPEERLTFWLDAHQRHPSFPLEKELIAIAAHPRNDHTILIDDLRKFKNWGFDLDVIKQRLLDINPDYEFSTLRGFIANDVLAAIPPTEVAA